MLAAGNPFVTAYVQSDWFGKGIFWGLFALSAISWIVLTHKVWIFVQVKRLSTEFAELFSDKDPLSLQFSRSIKGSVIEVPHPFFSIYKAFKQKALQLLSRNLSAAALSPTDLDLIESQVQAALAGQMKLLDKNLFILSTVVTLGPFLGLLGTVWGILLTFSQLHSPGASMNNAAMLAGLSLALATTVIGLVVAIPAVIGYNYLKNAEREYRREMEDFAYLLLAAIELQYRKPDHAQKTQVPV